MLSWPACTDKPPEPGVEPRPPEPGGHTGQAHCSEWLTPLRHQGRPDRRTNNRHLATAQSALCIASRIRNRYQISCQTRHKTVSVFWYQFSTPISGQCVMGVSLRGAAMAYATCRRVESNVQRCNLSRLSRIQASSCLLSRHIFWHGLHFSHAGVCVFSYCVLFRVYFITGAGNRLNKLSDWSEHVNTALRYPVTRLKTYRYVLV